jgi:hypothetical protein
MRHVVQPAEPFVTAKLKRRWFQFSLRAMLMVMTLVAIPLGRVAYLRQMAAFHDAEQARHLGEWRQEYASYEKGLGSAAEEARRRERYFHHKTLAAQYRKATYRPWTVVNEARP